MLFEGILDKIGLTDEVKCEYKRCEALADSRVKELADAFMKGEIEIDVALKELENMQTEDIHYYTNCLIFYLECTGPLYDKYKEHGYSDELYIDTMKDITCKINETLDVYEVIGISCPGWFSDYFKLKRFGFGRMQFDMFHHPCEDVEVGGYVVKEGDFILKGHVPSTGPLLREEYLKSYKAAYEFARDRFEGDVVPIEYWSWMLFPNYRDFFAEGSNTAQFIADYKVFGYYETDIFHDAWRFFGKDAGKDVLPTKTSLQRKFVEYMGPGKTYGYGKGIFMFDGENIIK